ncbi:hypothetical protein VTL71DRAFT_329 [Oculimacula yallundae]|uniref:F-box domain-containing protein n=1 Tax=Oculimacula yallundae TaxID=86028 RepID=A0ABR4CZT8_9HELO
MAHPNFSTIPDDILFKICTIVEFENPRTLHNLLFIKPTKSSAEAIIYRKVTIQGPRVGWSSAWPPFKILLGRLSDPQCSLRSLVRSLTITDWPGADSRELGAEELEILIGNLENLATLRWETPEPVPSIVLSKLHTSFPTALLSVRNRKRTSATPWVHHWNTAVDLDLRSSVQSSRLDFVVIQNGSEFPIGAGTSSNKELNKFPILNHILQRSSDICIQYFGCITGGSYMIGSIMKNEKMARNDVYESVSGKSDLFPTLKEIANLKKDRNIYYPPDYHLTKTQCIAWKTSINWKFLVELDLWNARVNDFFIIFRGHIPQLKILKFRLALESDSKDDRASLLRATKQFLDSIESLEELVILDWTRSFFADLCSSIARHGHSLRLLDINPSERSSNYVPGWAAEPLGQLLDSLPRLDKLAIAIDLLKSPGYWSPGSLAWSSNPISVLSKFFTIRTLQIRIRLPHINHVRAEIDPEGVAKMATDTFEAFRTQSPGSLLELVEIQVQRSEDVWFEQRITGVTAKVKKFESGGAAGAATLRYYKFLISMGESPVLRSTLSLQVVFVFELPSYQ